MLGTRSDWQAHMARSAAEIGVQGLRMHGALDDDLSIAPRKGEFHFYNLDVVYDNMLANGVRPIVELSFMPKAFVYAALPPLTCERLPMAAAMLSVWFYILFFFFPLVIQLRNSYLI